MSTGVELSDFENPVSMWKPAPKGYRSALRRSRNLSKDADKKNGVVVDVLPLKKRKFSSPSNSPSSRIWSQENEEAELEIDRKQRCRSADKETRKKYGGNIVEDRYSKFDYSEDFSGIEILAAAVCNDIIDDEEDITREGVDSSASAVLFEENTASGKDLASEDKKETSSQPSRLHWDLNTLMDAWDLPCDTFQDDSHMDCVETDLMAGNGETEMGDKCKNTSVGIVHDAKSSSQNEEACVTRSTNTDTQLSDCALRPCGEISSSDIQLDKVPCAVKVRHEQNNGGFIFRDDSHKANCETTCSISSDVENSCRASGGNEDKQLAQDMRKSVSHPSVVEHANQARSAGSALESQSVVNLGAKQPPNQVSSFENRSDSGHIKTELMEKACVECVDNNHMEGSSKVIHDPSDESYESCFYQDDKVGNFGTTNSAEVQAGHDSQIEDGELRESDACQWDENNDEDRELEHLDYGSESDEERHCSITKTKDQSIETCRTADAAKDECDSPKTRASDATTDKDFLSEEVGSRTSNKEEGSNLMHLKGAMIRSRYDHGGSTHSRDELGSNKDTHTRPRSRSPGGWVSERRYSNSFSEGYVNGPRGIKSMEDHGYAPYDRDNRTRRFVRFDNHVRGQFINHSSNRRFEHFNGTRSSNCMNRLYVRENSPTSNSFGRFSQDRGGFYKTALEDSSAYHSNRLVHSLGIPRRERSISPIGRGVRGFARFDNHVREQYPNRSLNSRIGHYRGRSTANGTTRLYVRDRDNSPTSTSFRRSPDRGGFYKPVMEDNSGYPNRLAHRMGMPRRERSISPVGRGTRGFARFDNHARGQFVNRSSNSRFEHSNRTRYSADGMNRLYARGSSPSNCFRRSPQAFERGERGGFYKPTLEGMPRRERSTSPVGRERSSHFESRSRDRASYVSAGEQIERSRLRSKSPYFKSDGGTDRVKMSFQKRVTVGSEDDFTSQKESAAADQYDPA